MEQNKNPPELKLLGGDKPLFIAACFFLALVFSYLIFPQPSLQILFVLLVVFSSAYVFSFLPSVILLSTVAGSLPLSVIVEDKGSGFSLIFPSEIFGGLLACTMAIKFLFQKSFNKKFILHPLTILLAGYILFNFIGVVFSVSHFVSVKAVFVKCVYVLAFYLAAYDVAKKNQAYVFVFYCIYIFSLSIVVLATLYKHSILEFDKGKVLLAVIPFFKDHTIYSACIAFVIPLLIGIFFLSVYKNRLIVFFYAAIVLVLFTGLFFSYSRAAILSILILIPILFFLKFKIRMRWFAMIFVAAGFFTWIYSDNIIFYLQQNRSNSNERFADLETQAKSITSISADESNAERLNRWKSALRMFNEKPFAGFGPGTYQFEYFPFQRYNDLTRISVFSPYNITQQGRGGTAHSEYLLILSECGIFAFVFFILFCASAILTGRKIYLQEENSEKRLFILCITCGLFTYLFHSMFNNFLDTDKAAFLFYSSIGVIVALDLENHT